MPLPELPRDARPLRFSIYDGLFKQCELVLLPDSSGATAAFLGFGDDADKNVTVLTVCTLSALMLSMREHPDPDWKLLGQLARELRDEAIFLRDGNPYGRR